MWIEPPVHLKCSEQINRATSDLHKGSQGRWPWENLPPILILQNTREFFLSHLDKAILCFYQCGCACDACWHAYYWQGESAQEELLAAWLSAFQTNATSVLSDDHNPNTQCYCQCVALDFTLTVHLCKKMLNKRCPWHRLSMFSSSVTQCHLSVCFMWKIFFFFFDACPFLFSF